MKRYVFMLFPVAVIFLSGFDFTKRSIPIDEIRSGGPPKDGIPSLTDPEFVAADKADFLRDSDRVLGVVIGGVAKAYPTRILSWHEAVNDTAGEEAFLVTW